MACGCSTSTAPDDVAGSTPAMLSEAGNEAAPPIPADAGKDALTPDSGAALDTGAPQGPDAGNLDEPGQDASEAADAGACVRYTADDDAQGHSTLCPGYELNDPYDPLAWLCPPGFVLPAVDIDSVTPLADAGNDAGTVYCASHGIVP